MVLHRDTHQEDIHQVAKVARSLAHPQKVQEDTVLVRVAATHGLQHQRNLDLRHTQFHPGQVAIHQHQLAQAILPTVRPPQQQAVVRTALHHTAALPHLPAKPDRSLLVERLILQQVDRHSHTQPRQVVRLPLLAPTAHLRIQNAMRNMAALLFLAAATPHHRVHHRPHIPALLPAPVEATRHPDHLRVSMVVSLAALVVTQVRQAEALVVGTHPLVDSEARKALDLLVLPAGGADKRDLALLASLAASVGRKARDLLVPQVDTVDKRDLSLLALRVDLAGKRVLDLLAPLVDTADKRDLSLLAIQLDQGPLQHLLQRLLVDGRNGVGNL